MSRREPYGFVRLFFQKMHIISDNEKNDIQFKNKDIVRGEKAFE